ncbi:MAG TPA: protein O-GlcNAcase [Micromonosporaceae bacterium]
MIRGTVEGFYGPPWSHQERLAHLEFSARFGLNTYVYAPKDDPYHRERWQDPYPSDKLDEIAELARAARTLGVGFTYAISPGLTMRFADDADHEALRAKAAQLADAGVGSFALFFDDVPAELTRPEDLARWSGEGAVGAAHGHACVRFVQEFLVPRGLHDPLLVCPADYAGTATSGYREQFARTAPPDVLVAWTGRDIVVADVTRDDIDRAAASYQRRVVLWDNFPVNDFDPTRLFLGPLTGRTTDLDGAPIAGVLSNPMVQAAPSQLPLATVADWARDPSGYDPQSSSRRALHALAGHAAPDLAPLVQVCSAWPPSREQDPELIRAAAGALAGAPDAIEVLTARLTELERACRAASQPEPLVSALRPWLDAGAATAAAGLSAVRLLRAATVAAKSDPDEHVEALRDQTRRALRDAEAHYANVLRAVVPPFVRDVLDRAAPPDVAAHLADRPVALLVTGSRPTAGDHALADTLERRGFAVPRRHQPTRDEIETASVVVVTGGADPDSVAAVARVAVPLLAWDGLVPLGLARTSDIVTSRDRVLVVDGDDATAGGLSGVITVYRGPGKLTVAQVGLDAHVVATTVDGAGALLYRYPPGSRLADGTVAPAARIGVFLGPEGPAPWLMTRDGGALLDAALDTLVAGYVARSA